MSLHIGSFTSVMKWCENSHSCVIVCRMMYWHDLSKSMIHGAYMDGQDMRHVLGNVSSVAHGLTLDQVRERFYWIDLPQVSLASTIQTSKLDGTDRFI